MFLIVTSLKKTEEVNNYNPNSKIDCSINHHEIQRDGEIPLFFVISMLLLVLEMVETGFWDDFLEKCNCKNLSNLLVGIIFHCIMYSLLPRLVSANISCIGA